MNKQYDFLIVGAGLFGSVCAHELTKKGFKVLVLEKRTHIGGNIYTERIAGINVHMYGAHIFHTSNDLVWDYVNQFAIFRNFVNSPIANYKGELFNLPFNMNTFIKLWPDVITPEDAKKRIDSERAEYANIDPTNLEEQAIRLVGKTVYEKLIKGYTSKQWGKQCSELPPFIIKRIPVRFVFDNNYFNDKYQGIPVGGYTEMIQRMLRGVDVRLGVDFLGDKEGYMGLARNTIYTGPIDAFFDYSFGKLEYRSLVFQHEVLDIDNFQGNAVINYTDSDTPYTRIIEHKFFENDLAKPKTVITREYPCEWEVDREPYYPINDDRNTALLGKYQMLAKAKKGVFFGGRLGSYKYLDMDKVVAEALDFICQFEN